MSTTNGIEIEKALLGCILIEPSLIGTCTVLPEMFSQNRQRVVYEAMQGLHKRDALIDPLTVIGELERVGALEAAGGMAQITALPDAVPTTANFPEYVRHVRDAAHLHEVKQAVKALESLAEQNAGVGSIQEAAARLARLSEPLTSHSTFHHITVPLEAMARYQDAQVVAQQTKQNSLVLSTPWPGLNTLMGGGFRGSRRPYLLCAQAKVGKSQVALKQLLHSAMAGIPVVLFSLELPQVQAAARLAGLICHINPDRALQWTCLSRDEMERVNNAMLFLRDLPIYFDGRIDKRLFGYRADPATTLIEMQFRLDRLERDGVKAGLVVIDHLGKIDVPGCKSEEVVKYKRMSEGLQDWATSSTYPIIGILHLDGKTENTKDVPSFRNIAWGQQMGRDCTMVLVADRPPLRKSASQREQMTPFELSEAQLIVDINEDGPTGIVPVNFDSVNGDWRAI